MNPALGIDCIVVLLALTSNGNTYIKLTFCICLLNGLPCSYISSRC